jgi:D-alanine---D-serine ligase
MRKLKIAVLFGGCSPEYNVSLQSAYSVITHLDGAKYDPLLLGITPKGEWFCFEGPPEKIRDGTWHNPADCRKAIISPDRATCGVVIFDKGRAHAVRLSAAMPVLHGQNGEDGTVQGLLELAGIPVIGCGVLSSALCLDKDKAHKIAYAAGIGVPRSFTIKKGEETVCSKQAKQLGYPLFVKPVKAGSSFGITKVLNQSGLPAALQLAFKYDSEAIVEENIEGIEIGCAVLGNGSPIVGVPDEIELTGGFFDFKEKYRQETSSIHVPARIAEDMAAKAQETAKTIYKALGCGGFARVDMFLTPSGEIIFNEVNTIPGFTAASRYPNMLKAAGITLTQMLDTAIELAVREEPLDALHYEQRII